MGLKKDRSEKENKIMSKRLGSLVEKSGVAEERIADAIGVSPSYLRLILNGETAPTYTVIY